MRKIVAYVGQPLVLIMILLAVIIQLSNSNFASLQNLTNMARQVSILAFVACGMTFAIVSGGIDLSVGSIMGVVSVVIATSMHDGTNYILAIILGIGVGVILGLINGLIINILDIHPFVVTLGTMIIYGGLAYIYTDGQQIGGFSDDFKFPGSGYLGLIPILVYCAFFAFLFSHIILESSKYGLRIRALGGKSDKTDSIGINPKLVVSFVYVFSGLMAAIAGILMTSRVMIGQPSLGTGYNLQAIAATTVGGVLLGGGYGKISGTLQGVILTGIISNGLNLIKVSSFWQYVASGVIIIIAMSFNSVARKNLQSIRIKV